MQIEIAQRHKAKIKMSLTGPSGVGKTYSALLLAHGIEKEWAKIAIIDSENYSASLYAHLGNFNIVNLTAPFSPLKYCEAIELCINAGMTVIIIDSITHEWSGKGGCLEMHEKETARMKIPNSFTAWSKITPLHQQFIDGILQSNCHVICTVRSKTDYVLTERNGKQIPQKVGMAPITRDGFEFEVSINFDVDQEHKAFTSKDRTRLFQDKEPFVITEDTGRLIKEWCETGVIGNIDMVLSKELEKQVRACNDVDALVSLYRNQSTQYQKQYSQLFTERRKQLQNNETGNLKHISSHLQTYQNDSNTNT